MVWELDSVRHSIVLLVLPRSFLVQLCGFRPHSGRTQSQFSLRTPPGDAAASAEPAQLRARRRRQTVIRRLRGPAQTSGRSGGPWPPQCSRCCLQGPTEVQLYNLGGPGTPGGVDDPPLPGEPQSLGVSVGLRSPAPGAPGTVHGLEGAGLPASAEHILCTQRWPSSSTN